MSELIGRDFISRELGNYFLHDNGCIWETSFDIITACINKEIEIANFLETLLLFLKKGILLINQTIDRQVLCHCYQKFMKGLYIISCQNILTISLMKFFAVFVRFIVHRMSFSNCFNHSKKY